MKKEIIITAKTVEEAMSDAYAKYSAEGDVSFEILEMPKKGFLGIGGTPAKVKVVIDDGEDDIDISDILSDVKSMSTVTDRGGDGKPAEKKPEPKANKADVEKKNAEPAPKKENKPADKPKAKPEEKLAKAEKAEKPAKTEAPAKKAYAEDNKKNKYEPVSEVEMQYAIEFVETVLRDLEIEAKAVSVKDEDGDFVGINIEGENTGALIGHHGETLDAIQYLANLSASRRSPTPNREFLKLTVDIENYRAKREDTLRALARRMAAKAVKYKRNFVLEPMNPYERRIIHSEIQQIENVDTHSVGSDENRKVVVTYEGADKSDRRSRQRRRRPNYNAAPAKVENDPVSPMSYYPVGDADEGIDLD
ncbi:MAG: Jag N-terminal domain-containing protein [Clostridia bacterium]|nr:Jag N-terminal domain-containing protein [Clostridia bacterium]